MLSCKQVVKLVSSEEQASWKKRLEVRMHLFLCHHCSKYVKQLELMTQAFKSLFQAKAPQAEDEAVKAIEAEVLKKLHR